MCTAAFARPTLWPPLLLALVLESVGAKSGALVSAVLLVFPTNERLVASKADVRRIPIHAAMLFYLFTRVKRGLARTA